MKPEGGYNGIVKIVFSNQLLGDVSKVFFIFDIRYVYTFNDFSLTCPPQLSNESSSQIYFACREES